MHEHPIRLRFLPTLDTILVCAVALYFLSNAEDPQSYWLLPLSAYWAFRHVLPYWKLSPTVAIAELAFFYVDMSIWDVLTGKVPHDRVHPKVNANNHCPVCDNPHSLYKIGGVGDFVRFVFFGLPLFISIVGVKLSALILGPLLYIGFSFRAKDFNELSLQAKAQYRSSFKPLWLFFGFVGIAAFLGKVVVYSYWNRLVDWWAAAPFLSEFDGIIRPAGFLLFHLSFLLGSVLLVVTTFLVDRSIHRRLDVGEGPESMPILLRTIRGLTRLRQVLMLYSWFCFVWLSVPWLRGLRFPPVTLELFPR